MQQIASSQADSTQRRVFLFYPPGKAYQRGEDRSQGNIDQSSATAMRAPNDMGYAAAGLKSRGYQVFFRDYQSERQPVAQLIADFTAFRPDVVAISITNSTIFSDLEIVADLKSLSPFTAILKGALLKMI